MSRISVLGFAGSLRKDSFNKAMLRAAVELAPGGMEIEIFDLEGIPPFNQDLEHSMPEKVRELKAKIRKADGILIVTPEYNYSMPGVLKNAIDWASRPPGDNSFEDKPAAIISASTGMLGGVRAQHHLRQTLAALNVHAVNRPEVIISSAAEKVDESGRLKDDKTSEKIRELLGNLLSFIERIRKTGAETAGELR